MTDSDENRVRFARKKLQELRDAEDRVAPRDAIDEIFRVNTPQQVEPEAEALRAQLEAQRHANVQAVQEAEELRTQLKKIEDLESQVRRLEEEKARFIATQKEPPPKPPPQAPPQTLTEHGVEFVLIPAGEFMMGSPDSEAERRADEYQHLVQISNAFYLSTYEVTQAEWEAVMGSNPSRFKGDPNLPVENVSWEDVQAFLRKLNAQGGVTHYRLPTEAEWEYAARAGTTTVFHYGNTLDATQANFDGNYPYGGARKGPYLGRTTAVGSYQANAFGLYDMHGNVWEWVQDWYDEGYYTSSPTRDPQGPDSGVSRVLRGGGWFFDGRLARSAQRGAFDPGGRDHGTGFRFARGQASSR